MFHPAVALADQQKRVALVGNIADESGGRLDHLLQVGQHFLAVHGGGHVFHGDVVGHALHFETQHLLRAHQDRAIVKHVEVGRGERARASGDRVESGGDGGPILRRHEGDRRGPIRMAGEMDECSRRGKQGAILAQVVLYGEGDGAVNVVGQGDDG